DLGLGRRRSGGILAGCRSAGGGGSRLRRRRRCGSGLRSRGGWRAFGGGGLFGLRGRGWLGGCRSRGAFGGGRLRGRGRRRRLRLGDDHRDIVGVVARGDRCRGLGRRRQRFRLRGGGGLRRRRLRRRGRGSRLFGLHGRQLLARQGVAGSSGLLIPRTGLGEVLRHAGAEAVEAGDRVLGVDHLQLRSLLEPLGRLRRILLDTVAVQIEQAEIVVGDGDPL